MRRAGLGLLLASCPWHADVRATGSDLHLAADSREKFETVNPTLAQGQLNIDRSRAQEITAYLRPNPDVGFDALDGTQLTPYRGVYRPFSGTQMMPSISYLHEREEQRELRLENAQKGTAVAHSQQDDLDAHDDLQPAQRLCADPAGQSRAGSRAGEPTYYDQ